MHDFIVVGAGSAGSVLASRLTEDPSVRVLLVEAGPARIPRESRIPAAFARLFRTRFDWAFETEPEPALDGRALFWPRGRLLGGSSAMNAMIWTRPARSDFERWVELGCEGWSYDDVAPAFDRAEVRLAPGARLDRVGIPVADLRSPNPLSHVFLEAARGSGLGANAGFGDGTLDGAGWFRVTQERGRRVSAATGYLTRAVRRRPNLTIAADTLVSRLLVERERATGVEYTRAGTGGVERADGRVILAAGAVGSPHILLRSGIGPAAELEAMGVPVRLDLPAVGRHLQDHLASGIGYACSRPITLAGADGVRHLLSYALRGRGPLTSNVAEAGAFVRLDPSAEAPDVELLFAPSYFVDHGAGNPPGHGYTIAAVLQHPRSEGRVSLASADPATPPRIEASYLSDPADAPALIAGLELARRVGEHPAFAPYRGAEILPGPTGDLQAHLRRYSETLYHPVGTCRMGPGRGSVVSPRLAVHGIEGLWVADASVMPSIPTGHTHGPVVAIAERAAALIPAGAGSVGRTGGAGQAPGLRDR